MQKLLLPAALLCFVSAAHGQKVATAQVLAAAKATFKAKFPTVQRPT